VTRYGGKFFSNRLIRYGGKFFSNRLIRYGGKSEINSKFKTQNITGNSSGEKFYLSQMRQNTRQ